MLPSPGAVESRSLSANLENSDFYEILYIDRELRDERSGF
jgi:hypothetical protein